jgi:ABC-type branched-subunit amino acid transport system substrate-binding protein
VIGPYATPNIVSAMGVAQRYNKILVHHTMGIPSLAKYDMQFPAWSVGPNPEATVPNTVLDALATLPKPPKTVAIVTSKFPSVYLMSKGAQEVMKKRGLSEVLFLEWEFGNRDYGAIANRVKDAKPDFVWVGAIGLEGNQLLDAMKKIDYTPPLHFYMYPAPGPLAKLPEAKNALAASIFEQHPPFTNNPVAAEFVKIYNDRAAKAGLPDNAVETQAAASFSTWQVLEAAIKATNGLNDKAMSDWLKKNQVDTIQGRLRFDKTNNYGDDLMRVKQVQNGHWVTVWPKEWAAPGAKILGQ